MRELAKNENVVSSHNIVQYFDELGRNTYYFNRKTGKWVEKRWIRLSDGRDKEIHVWTSDGYWRKHEYDIFRSRLVREFDSHANRRNLLDLRRAWNPHDNEISEEIELGKLKQDKPAEALF